MRGIHAQALAISLSRADFALQFLQSLQACSITLGIARAALMLHEAPLRKAQCERKTHSGFVS